MCADPIGKAGAGIVVVVVVWVVIVFVVLEVVVFVKEIVLIKEIHPAEPSQFILSIPLFSGLGSVQTDKSCAGGTTFSLLETWLRA